MKETVSYWTAWSPYWSYLEDFFLDLEAIDKLEVVITYPVLIIGAGQGLLVEQLQKKNFIVDGIELDPQMISYAKKRRGLDLIEADARNMPFANNSYKTSIVATGVVDFMDDEEQIKLIINEALRVTDDSGKVFIAFYKYTPKVETLLKHTGIITDNSSLRYKKLYEMIILSSENPIGFIRTIQNEANVGFLKAFFISIKSQMFISKKEKKEGRKIFAIWKRAKNELDNPQSLIDCLPELIPYRSGEQIRGLFKNLNFSIKNMHCYGSCTIVQL